MVDVAVVRRRLQSVDEPRRRNCGQNLPADELDGAHLALDPGLRAEDPALAGHAVDLLPRHSAEISGTAAPLANCSKGGT